jgi:hypothetical protein
VPLAATLVGRGVDLATASMAVDGAEVAATVTKQDARTWALRFATTLPAGPHTARVSVRDALGQAGGFTWQFVVGNPEPTATPAPAPAPEAKPEQQAAPAPTPPAARQTPARGGPTQ